MNLYSVIILLFIFGCSSTPNSKHKVKTKLVGDTTLPESVDLLINMKQDDSVDYEIASFKAATDLINLGKVQMESYNSGEALRFLSLGSNLLPYRDDIKYLYRKAVDNYVSVTNAMINDKDFTCSELFTRIDFLKIVSPDSLLSLQKRSKECPYEAPRNSDQFSFSKIAGQKQEKPQLEYEKHAEINLSNDLNYLLKMNEFVPVMEILNIVIDGMGSLSIESKNIKLSSLTRNSEDVVLEMDYEINEEKSIGESSQTTCERLKELLNIEDNNYRKGKSGCRYAGYYTETLEINTSEKVKSLIDRNWLHFFPSVLVFNVDFVYRNNTIRNFKYLSLASGGSELDFSTWEKFKEGKLPKQKAANLISFLPYQKDGVHIPVKYDKEFDELYRYYRPASDLYPENRIRKGVYERKKTDFRFQMPVIRTSQETALSDPKIIINKVSKEDIQDLISIRVSLDRDETYKFWRNTFKNEYGMWP